ncbi:cointegrate resolution protein T, partial [Pseudomonas sihuiensis]
KQDELTQLNRDNARLLTEARQLQKEQHAQQQLLTQKVQALEAAQSSLIGAERANEALEQRCGTLQETVSQLSETSATQAQQVQSLQERLTEAIMRLKLLGHTPLTNSGNETGT